jgi:uncharacterized protein
LHIERSSLNMQTMPILDRQTLLTTIETLFRSNPVVMLLGPRQCGKTTLARQFSESKKATWFDLENPQDAQRLSQPLTGLQSMRGFVVIDEAQLAPALFPVLRVLADRKPLPARFLLLGSAAPELMSNVAESLAGRVAMLPMGGFSLTELPNSAQRKLWWRGSFPRSFLASADQASVQWRNDFVQTFLERDLRRFGVLVAPAALRRFWLMAAHYHGQLWNGSEIGRSLGEAHTTVKRHLDIMTGAFVIRQLPPWYENVGKRQVKAPKVYIRDSGLLHALLGINSFAALEGHPKLGASWEGFALEQVLAITGERDAYFWTTQGLAELDLLVFINGRRIGFKYADAPGITKSLAIARNDLQLEHVFILHPGNRSYPLDSWIDAVALRELPDVLLPLLKSKQR